MTEQDMSFKLTWQEVIAAAAKLELGETSTTAYAGDKGAKNANDIEKNTRDIGLLDSRAKAVEATTSEHTEEIAKNANDIEKNSDDISFLKAVAAESGLTTVYEIQEAYTERTTANGAAIYSCVPAKVKRIEGASFSRKNIFTFTDTQIYSEDKYANVTLAKCKYNEDMSRYDETGVTYEAGATLSYTGDSSTGVITMLVDTVSVNINDEDISIGGEFELDGGGFVAYPGYTESEYRLKCIKTTLAEQWDGYDIFSYINLPAGTYTYSCEFGELESGYIEGAITCEDASGNSVANPQITNTSNSATFTTEVESQITFVTIVFLSAAFSGYKYVIKPMLVEGDEVYPYVPYGEGSEKKSVIKSIKSEGNNLLNIDEKNGIMLSNKKNNIRRDLCLDFL